MRRLWKYHCPPRFRSRAQRKGQGIPDRRLAILCRFESAARGRVLPTLPNPPCPYTFSVLHHHHYHYHYYDCYRHQHGSHRKSACHGQRGTLTCTFPAKRATRDQHHAPRLPRVPAPRRQKLATLPRASSHGHSSQKSIAWRQDADTWQPSSFSACSTRAAGVNDGSIEHSLV